MIMNPEYPLQDDILAEIHAAREQHAAGLNYDLHAICEESRLEEQSLAADGWRVVNFVRPAQPLTPQPA